MDETTKTKINELINSNKVFLFMKGTPDSPACGFSHLAVSLIHNHTSDLKTFDILSDDDIRQGVKEFSNWPTFPQLYVNGKLIGGSDIIKELEEKGKLKGILMS
jgi:Grx4 family monothiol glutaredoxin